MPLPFVFPQLQIPVSTVQEFWILQPLGKNNEGFNWKHTCRNSNIDSTNNLLSRESS
jgi:hypothetical protein